MIVNMSSRLICVLLPLTVAFDTTGESYYILEETHNAASSNAASLVQAAGVRGDDSSLAFFDEERHDNMPSVVYPHFDPTSTTFETSISYASAESQLLRNLQQQTPQTANYRANYIGRFQYLLDGLCTGPYPVLNAYCSNGGSIQVISTSDSTITCQPLLDFEGDGEAVQCTNTCTDPAACAEIWLESGNAKKGVFGEIYFQCEGENPSNVEGTFSYEDSGDASCRLGNIDGRNFHVAQMGIFCADPTSVTGGEYSYGDFYFECDRRNIQGDFGSAYTCFDGRNCKSSQCTVEFDRVVVETDVHRLDCIQSLDGAAVPAISSPEIIKRPAGDYTARFQANWHLDTSSRIWCSGKFPKIQVQCSNGEILLIDTLFDTTTCVDVDGSTNTLECIESDSDTFVESYSGVVFDCIVTDKIPTAMVQYPPYEVTCNSSVEHDPAQKVQLGVFCGSAVAGGAFVFSDYYTECDIGVGFEIEDGKYTCSNRVISPGGDSTPVLIEEVKMFMDYRWENYAGSACYSFVAGVPVAPFAASSETPVASQAPVTSTPITLAPTPMTSIDSDRKCPATPDEGCSICGENSCVRRPDAVFTFPGQPDVACGVLQVAGYTGVIDLEQCVLLSGLVSSLCGCADGATPAPAATLPSTPHPMTPLPSLPSPSTPSPTTLLPTAIPSASLLTTSLPSPLPTAPLPTTLPTVLPTLIPATPSPTTPVPSPLPTLLPTTPIPTTPVLTDIDVLTPEPTTFAPVLSPEMPPVAIPPLSIAPVVVTAAIPPGFTELINNRKREDEAIKMERKRERDKRRQRNTMDRRRGDVFDEPSRDTRRRDVFDRR